MKTRFATTLTAVAVAAALNIAPANATGASDQSFNSYFYNNYFKKFNRVNRQQSFDRVATFPVFENTDIDTETVAEIVAASNDGMTLIYTDSENDNVGFVDITDPSIPTPLGVVDLNGEPTSVSVARNYALVAVNTSVDFVNTSGELVVIDINSQTIVETFPLSGQPDSVAVSPNQRFAAIAIENERDEDLIVNGEEGALPQAPGGFLITARLFGQPSRWKFREVSLDGLADNFPEDPEVEYVDINRFNVAAVSLQENNHLVLVHVPTGYIINDFSAGTVSLDQIDTSEEPEAFIDLSGSIENSEREPDGLSWTSNRVFATANEGDINDGGRGFTLFNKRGRVVFESGNSFEHEIVRVGHYPDGRSENRGNEPENVEFGRFGRDNLLFVGSERAHVVLVYKVNRRGTNPRLQQVLPTGVRPEGLLAIPHRNLFVAATEDDDRGDGFRSTLTIFQRTRGEAEYPTIESINRADGTPIPWSALSALAAGDSNDTAYTVQDSFFVKSRIFKMDVSDHPAVIEDEIVLRDDLGLLAASDPSLINDDGSVNLDPEGLSVRAGGGFWLASEGDDSPFLLNYLLGVTEDGLIDRVITLPDTTTARMVRFGFEGVAAVGDAGQEVLYVAFQREWTDDPDGQVRIGRFDTVSGEWTFFYYPINTVESANGGFVGLSELVALGNQEFAVIERDNQAGEDAVIKRIYKFSIAGLTALPDTEVGITPNFPLVSKELVRDLVSDLEAPGGAIIEKVEGMAVLPSGETLVVTDNDGGDDSNGETQLLRINGLF